MGKVEGKITEVLRQAEREILGFLADAAAQGDYEGIDSARNAASRVRQLAGDLGAKGGSTPRAAASEGRTAVSTVRRRRTKADQGAEAYPRFAVENNCLLREGWSKKQRKPYTHRVPGDVFQAVIAALQRIAEGSNGAVMADVILQEPGLREDSPVPSYQVYTVLGFLRSENVVRETGRGRYQLPPDLKQQAVSLWERGAAVGAE